MVLKPLDITPAEKEREADKEVRRGEGKVGEGGRRNGRRKGRRE